MNKKLIACLVAIIIGLSIFAGYEAVNVNNSNNSTNQTLKTSKADSFELLLEDNGYTIQRINSTSEMSNTYLNTPINFLTVSPSQFLAMINGESNNNNYLGQIYRLGNSFYVYFFNATTQIYYLLEITP